MTAGSLRAGRRRTALNEALHELRRPLQTLVLTAPASRRDEPALASSLQLAVVALERLDREVNGGATVTSMERLRARPLLEAATGRWRDQVTLAGGSMSLRWGAGEAALRGDRCALAQALDNLIVNAIEHGGPHVSVDASHRHGSLQIAVRDSGRGAGPISGRERSGLVDRLTGRRRRGHGLRLVRRTAAVHGGRFELRCTEAGTVAVLELPLLVEGWMA